MVRFGRVSTRCDQDVFCFESIRDAVDYVLNFLKQKYELCGVLS